MNHVTVTLPDGSRRSVPQGTTVRELMADLPPRVAKSALAAVVDDKASIPFFDPSVPAGAKVK